VSNPSNWFYSWLNGILAMLIAIYFLGLFDIKMPFWAAALYYLVIFSGSMYSFHKVDKHGNNDMFPGQ